VAAVGRCDEDTAWAATHVVIVRVDFAHAGSVASRDETRLAENADVSAKARFRAR
jgi:hypothetical protein